MNKLALKIIVATVVFLVLGFITLTRVNILDYEKPIGYEYINEISFKNFRGLEFFQKSLYGNKSFAYVDTSIDYEFEEDSLKIESFFHPSSSYAYSKNSYRKALLTHEMYHFKITELYARIAKKRISALRNSSKNQIKDLIAQIRSEERKYQMEYDDDTFHSYVLSEQKKYEKNIDSLLSLHDHFKKSKIIINEK